MAANLADQSALAVGHRFGQVVHVAYLVDDIDAAMRQWVEQLGIGPWTCIRNIDLDAVNCGTPMRLRIHEALAYAGTLQIQLVQSLNDPAEPTPYQSRVVAKQWGLHHVAYFSDDIDRDIATAMTQGFERSCEMRSADGHRYIYMRSLRPGPELWIEFLEVFPLITDLYQQGIAETAAWDGRDPIRNLDYADLV